MYRIELTTSKKNSDQDYTTAYTCFHLHKTGFLDKAEVLYFGTGSLQPGDTCEIDTDYILTK